MESHAAAGDVCLELRKVKELLHELDVLLHGVDNLDREVVEDVCRREGEVNLRNVRGQVLFDRLGFGIDLVRHGARRGA